MRDVAIIGVGMQRFGELWEMSLRDLFVDVALKAIDDAGVDRVDSLVVGSMSSGLFVEQEHVSNLLADELGMGPIPATRVEAACASGGMALRAGVAEVASGMSELVLVAGVEKMTDVGAEHATHILATAMDQEYEAFHGLTFPGLSAMVMRAYMERYGAKPAEFAAVAVKNHRHGMLNPLAQFRAPLTVEAVMGSTLISDPIRLLDCAPISDGAAAVLLAPLERARSLQGSRAVRLSGIGAATDRMAFYRRPDLTRMPAIREAAQRAFRASGRGVEDIDVAELHDGFTIMEVCALEEIGFCEPGKGAAAAPSGMTELGGKIPVNPSGGLKARGHPVGATGVAQVCELVVQLRGEAGERQVEGACTGLSQNIGGIGGTAVVTIVERC